MPLVFVHGVSNRAGPGYDQGVEHRNALFRQFLLASHKATSGTVEIRNPYWGDLGGTLAWNGASVPLTKDDFEALGAYDPDVVDLVELAAEAPSSPRIANDGDAIGDENVLLLAARVNLGAAVDLLWSAAQFTAVDPVALARTSARAIAYATATPRPAWLSQANDDATFVSLLINAIDDETGDSSSAPLNEGEPTLEPLGISDVFDNLREAAYRVRDAVVNRVGRELSDRIRPALVPGIASFLGDIFVYLRNDADTSGEITERVNADVRAASELRTADDPLIVVAHSLGGIVAYDLLSSTGTDIDVDVFVTVGSQIAFFEELKLFRSSRRDIPGAGGNEVDRPPGIKRWINVFDFNDPLSFVASHVFGGVEDHPYETASALKAHSTYFKQPRFHERLAARVIGTA